MIEYIRSQLTDGEQMAGLAEEATELAHAALKLRRVVDGSNPTPVKEKEAVDNLLEEIGDVLLCLKVLGFPVEPDNYEEAMDAKLERWAKRLGAPCTKRTPADAQPSEETWNDCHNCGNYETKAGCKNCVSAIENGRRVSGPSMWKPKEDAE